MNLTRIQTKYLILIYDLQLKGYVRSCDLAKIMGVTTPCVHRVLEQLVEKDVVSKKKYAKVSLTETGNSLAQAHYFSYSALKELFEKKLGASADDAIQAALALVSELEPESVRGICENIVRREIVADHVAGS